MNWKIMVLVSLVICLAHPSISRADDESTAVQPFSDDAARAKVEELRARYANAETQKDRNDARAHF